MTEVPIALLRVYCEMLPRLRAEDMLSAAQATALGSGAMKKAASTSLQQQLQRQMRGGRRKAAAPVRLDQLPAMGIGVQFVDNPTTNGADE